MIEMGQHESPGLNKSGKWAMLVAPRKVIASLKT
jgi:hypothetical protein